jgi:drug/metabolite transporter (DMT)-like permease
MNWVFVALLAPLIYTGVTFVDKYLLESEVSDYNAMPIFMGIVAAVAGVILFTLTGFPVLPVRDALIVLSTGILSAYALSLYFRAMSMEEASNINILFQTFPVVTLVLSFFLLGERISTQQFLGFLLILSAGLGVSMKRGDKFFELSPAFFLILTHNVLWALSGVLMKFALSELSFREVLSYESFGIALGALFLYVGTPSIRAAFAKVSRVLSNRGRTFIVVNEILTILAKATTFFAFSIGPVTLVSVLEGFQTFYAIALGWILTMLFPKIFQEDISSEGIARKVLCAVIAVFGLFLIS